jgi:hypothetical protein
MKYLKKQPIVFGTENNQNYEDTWERVFGKKKFNQDTEQVTDQKHSEHEEEF